MDELELLKLHCLENPHDPEAWREYAMGAVECSDFKTAIDAAGKAVAISPEPLYVNLCARLELLAGDPRAAKHHFSSILNDHPDAHDARAGLGMAELAMGDIAKAEETFAEVLRGARDNEEALVGKAKIELTKGNPDVAAEICVKALEGDVGDPDPLIMTLGEAVLRMKDVERATQIFAQATEINPENLDAWIALINVQMLGENTAKAEVSLTAAKKVFSANPALMFLEAQIAIVNEDTAKARALLMTLLEGNPDALDVRVSLAALELAEGRNDSAGAIIAPAIADASPRPDALLVAASIAEAGEDFANAAKYAKRVTLAVPDYFPALASLGRNLAKSGDIPGARAALKEAISLAEPGPQLQSTQQLLNALPL